VKRVDDVFLSVILSRPNAGDEDASFRVSSVDNTAKVSEFYDA